MLMTQALVEVAVTGGHEAMLVGLLATGLTTLKVCGVCVLLLSAAVMFNMGLFLATQIVFNHSKLI